MLTYNKAYELSNIRPKMSSNKKKNLLLLLLNIILKYLKIIIVNI